MLNYKPLYLLGFLLLASAALIFLCFTETDNDKDKQYRDAFSAHNQAYAVNIPGKVSFAGEEISTDPYYIREGLDRELLVNTYWHSNTLQLLKRANRYFPVIETILKKNNVPGDFKYLALIESGLLNVVSPSNAAGFWQFLDKTGRQYGLEVTEQVDERYHLVKSTEAACRYLKEAHSKYNNWTLAAASYNAGQGRISREWERQKTTNYYDLYLNAETSRYIYRIIAMKLICENPAAYGFYLRNKDLYPPFDTYTVKTDTSIADLLNFAARYSINYRILKEFNPWLRSDQLKVLPGRSYLIDLPEKHSINYSGLMKKVNDPDSMVGLPLSAAGPQ